jgi:hypothetical protein
VTAWLCVYVSLYPWCLCVSVSVYVSLSLSVTVSVSVSVLVSVSVALFKHWRVVLTTAAVPLPQAPSAEHARHSSRVPDADEGGELRGGHRCRPLALAFQFAPRPRTVK